MPFVPRADYDPPVPELVQLGRALRAMREEHGLKQIEVASGAKVTESQISDIERGKNNPGWVLVARIVEGGLGLTIGDLADAYMRAGRDNQDR